MQSPKVVFYAHYRASGDVGILLPALVACGCGVTYVYTGEAAPDALPAGVHLIHRPMPFPARMRGVSGRARMRLQRSRRLRKVVDLLKETIARKSPVVVIGSDCEIGVPPALAAAGRIPVIGVSHGSDVLVVPGRSDRQRVQLIKALTSCRSAIAFSKFHEHAVQELAPALRVSVLRPSVDCEMFSPNARPKSALPVVLCLRGSAAVYRPEVVIEAAGLALREIPFVLRMAMDTADAPCLRELAVQCGLSESTFVPVLERVAYADMPREYAAATVVFQAIERESLGYTALETMACGRALVQPASPLCEELLSHEQKRYLAVTGDARSLADVLVRGLASQDERGQVEAANRQHVLRTFDRRNVIPALAGQLTGELSQLHEQT